MAQHGFDTILGAGAAEWKAQVTEARLSLAEVGGLVHLLVEASGHPECCLPDDDALLARLSGLAGQWEGSNLRRELGRWLQPLPGGRLQATALALAKGKHEVRQTKARLAGQASWTARRQLAEDPSCIRRTDVRTDVRDSGAEGGADARNPKTRKGVRLEEAHGGEVHHHAPAPPTSPDNRL
jgi:hypothetical protein